MAELMKYNRSGNEGTKVLVVAEMLLSSNENFMRCHEVSITSKMNWVNDWTNFFSKKIALVKIKMVVTLQAVIKDYWGALVGPFLFVLNELTSVQIFMCLWKTFRLYSCGFSFKLYYHSSSAAMHRLRWLSFTKVECIYNNIPHYSYIRLLETSVE